MSANPNAPFRRLVRPEIIRAVARIKRHWSKLPYPRFVIQAEHEMNPEHSNDPDANMSVAESVAGFLTPIPIQLRNRNTDIRMFFDMYNRPNLYMTRLANNQRLNWNLDPANVYRMIYCFAYQVVEVDRRGRETLVRHKYLQTLRGVNKVRELDEGYVHSIDGFEQRREAIQGSADIRTVDRLIDQTITENEHIQNGGL